ncbi:hypothetical protein WN48_03322 [Eufriesea mexicana]|uniref:Small ribosomal subunit protein mS39 n=1 Tax=Eufriesea mexicana TaxID=516756 RepID=A0A310SF54_9HYME|nr:hypothetical protein WN48_03322 [Eufriesea mexicana]
MFRGDIILNIALVPAYRSALYSIVENGRQRGIKHWRETKDKSEDDTNLTKYVEDAGRISWCEIKRFKSSISVSNSKVCIPYRIKRGPTDILRALESTIPENIATKNYVFRKDPYLSPTGTINNRSYGLSYESGRKAAIWIHNEHKDLFPKHLSEPQIDVNFIYYRYKSEVSEEMLLHAISCRKISDAVHIYNLLEDNISDETKQVLLELLCFYQNENKLLNKLHFELHFQAINEKYTLGYRSEINKLYQSLISVASPITVAAAHNTMICGLIKSSKMQEAWLLYKKCREENVPFNVTTYNYVLSLYKHMFDNDIYLKMQSMFEILTKMSKDGIKPNIKTLNTVLQVISTIHGKEIFHVVEHVVRQFMSIGIKPSLATYAYMLFTLQNQGVLRNTYDKFKDIIEQVVSHEKFIIEDAMDYKFFICAMHLTLTFNDRKSAYQIDDLLLAQDKWFLYQISETNYYIKYILCILSNSNFSEFFGLYTSLVPNRYLPSKYVYNDILKKCSYITIEELTTYLPRLWSDLDMIHNSNLELKLTFLRLYQMNMLSFESTLKTTFMNIAQNCWDIIKMKMNSAKYDFSIETNMMASIALIFLHGDNINESIKVLEYTVKTSNMFIPTMTDKQLNELFEYYISKQCTIGAFLVLECSINLGFKHIVQKATELYNLPQLTNDDRDRLTNLVGAKMLHTSKSN